MLKKICMVIVGATLVVAHCLIGGAAFAANQENGQPCPPECVTDSMEIVTWYPSPYNEYEELRLYPTQRDDNYCDNDKIGLMYYDDGGTPSFPEDDKMKVCKGLSLGWQEVGGEGFWKSVTGNTNDIYYTQSGNVGIGTSFPSEKLEVSGGIKIGNSGNVAAGTVRWTGSDFEGYNGSEWVSFTLGGSSKYGNYKNIFTADGSFTVPAGVSKITVEVWGAGGGGAGGGGGGYEGGGGGAGGYGRQSFTVTSGAIYPVNVGTGGSGGQKGDGGVYGTSGIAGGSSKFGSLVSASGGGGGKGADVGGAGGSGGTSAAVNNASGGSGVNFGTYCSSIPSGGSSYSGDGGAGGCGRNNGQEGVFPGGGGGGGGGGGTGGATANECGNGGKGANGKVVVWWG